MGESMNNVNGSITMSHREIQEFMEIVAETKEDETRQALAQAEVRVRSRPKKEKIGSEEDGFLSLKWLLDTETDADEANSTCFKFCCRCPKKEQNKRTKSQIAAIVAWDIKYCKTFDDFLNLMRMVTANAEETIQGLQSIMSKLAFKDDADPEVQKLSVIGGYLWLITYGMQYITISHPILSADPSMTGTEVPEHEEELQFHLNTRSNIGIRDTREAYEDIGETVQEWVPLALQFVRRAKELRVSGAELVKLLHQRFKFTKNPFKEHPEFRPPETAHRHVPVAPYLNTVEVPVSRDTAEKSKLDTLEQERGLLNQSLKIQWSPVVVLVQAMPGGPWDVFSSLDATEKVELIAMFAQEPLRLLNYLFKTYKRCTAFSDVVEQPDSARLSSIMEVTCGLLHFTSSSKYKKLKLSVAEVETLGMEVEKFWASVDTLYELGLRVSKLVNETRDIVRSCYIYSDNFYNWNLKSFDLFGPPKQSSEQEYRMKKFINNVVGATDVVDVAKFYSIADFTTSRYQYVLQQNPVSSRGVALKLESWDDPKNEPWGLVDDMVDKRKLKSNWKKKSRHFTLAYKPSS